MAKFPHNSDNLFTTAVAKSLAPPEEEFDFGDSIHAMNDGITGFSILISPQMGATLPHDSCNNDDDFVFADGSSVDSGGVKSLVIDNEAALHELEKYNQMLKQLSEAMQGRGNSEELAFENENLKIQYEAAIHELESAKRRADQCEREKREKEDEANRLQQLLQQAIKQGTIHSLGNTVSNEENEKLKDDYLSCRTEFERVSITVREEQDKNAALEAQLKMANERADDAISRRDEIEMQRGRDMEKSRNDLQAIKSRMMDEHKTKTIELEAKCQQSELMARQLNMSLVAEKRKAEELEQKLRQFNDVEEEYAKLHEIQSELIKAKRRIRELEMTKQPSRFEDIPEPNAKPSHYRIPPIKTNSPLTVVLRVCNKMMESTVVADNEKKSEYKIGDSNSISVTEHLLDLMKSNHGFPRQNEVPNYDALLSRLREECSRAEGTLLSNGQAMITVPQKEGNASNVIVGQMQLESARKSLINHASECVLDALNGSLDGVTRVILTGDSARMPGFATGLQEFFKPSQYATRADASEANSVKAAGLKTTDIVGVIRVQRE